MPLSAETIIASQARDQPDFYDLRPADLPEAALATDALGDVFAFVVHVGGWSAYVEGRPTDVRIGAERPYADAVAAEYPPREVIAEHVRVGALAIYARTLEERIGGLEATTVPDDGNLLIRWTVERPDTLQDLVASVEAVLHTLDSGATALEARMREEAARLLAEGVTMTAPDNGGAPGPSPA